MDPGHAEGTVSRLACEHLVTPPEELDKVAGERKVWGALPRSRKTDEWMGVDGCMGIWMENKPLLVILYIFGYICEI